MGIINYYGGAASGSRYWNHGSVFWYVIRIATANDAHDDVHVDDVYGVKALHRVRTDIQLNIEFRFETRAAIESKLIFFFAYFILGSNMVYPYDEAERIVRLVARTYGKELFKYPNVVGYSNTPKPRIRKGRIVPEEKVLRVYVVKKVPEDQLRADEIIPKRFHGVPTDVVEIGKLRALQVHAERYRPIPCGVSTSRADEAAAGTIGWWVVTKSLNLYLISNNHVWAKENNGSPGDPLVQPGILDGGDPSVDVFAELVDFVPIDFSGNPNYVDVAVAKCLDMKQCYAAIMEIGGIASARDPVVGETVRKVGRSTGLTLGTVTDDSATVQVSYATGDALFEDVAIVEASEKIVQAGDSGSPVIGDDKAFLGLLFAGNDEGTVYVFCKTSRIEEQLTARFSEDVRILTVNAPTPYEKVIEYRYVFVTPSPTLWLESMYSFMLTVMMFSIVVGIIRAVTK